MKRIIAILVILMFICTFALTVSAETKKATGRLIDGAAVLSDIQNRKISSRLDDISEKYDYDVFIITATSTTYSISDYVDLFVAENCKDNTNAVVLLVCFNHGEREWQVSSYGDAKNAIDSTDREYVLDSIQSAIGDDDYLAAFNAFIDDCEYYIDGYVNGFPFEFGTNVVISLLIGFIIAFVSVSIMKGKLKTVRFQQNATDYIKQGSMNVTVARDFYLYSTVTRIAKPKTNNSGGFSSGGSHSSRKF